jgi:integrase
MTFASRMLLRNDVNGFPALILPDLREIFRRQYEMILAHGPLQSWSSARANKSPDNVGAKALAAASFYTGVRKGELTKVNWDPVDFNVGVIAL